MANRKTTVKPRRKSAPKIKQAVVSAVIDPNELSPQMLLFVDHYIVCMNGTQSARLAEYSGDDATLAATASRLLRNDKVLREIERRLATFSMSANEVLIHLTDVARGDIADAMDKSGKIDLTEARRRGKSHLVKRFKHKTKTITTTDNDGDNGSDILEEEFEIEMYDRMDALKTLAKFHALLIDRVRVDDWRSDAIADIKAGKISFEALADAFDRELATELFRSAGVPVQIGAGEEE